MQSYGKALLIAGVVVGTVAPVAAQVDKPTSEPTARLPAPKIVATQLPNGPIQVTWSAVDGAAKYTLTRSVPPAGSQVVSLPNPADTQYVDADVRPGSTYYHLVGAINEAGTVGLKAGSAPVLAQDMARAPAAPADVRAVLNATSVVLSWRPLEPDLRYRVEQGTMTAGGPTGFFRLNDPICCQLLTELRNLTPGTRVVYRVTAVNVRGMTSPPGISNEISVPGAETKDTGGVASTDSTAGGGTPGDSTAAGSATAKVRPAIVVPTAKLKVGARLNLATNPSFQNLQLRQVHWTSLNQSSATVDAKGQVRGVAPGTSHVIALGLRPDSAVASLVQWIEVTR